MRYFKFLVLLPALLLSAVLAYGQITINAKGSAGAPVAIGTATPKVIMAPGSRCGWTWLWTEAGNLACQPVPLGTSSPASTPAVGIGMLFTAARVPWNSNAVDDDPSVGWSCVSTSGTLNIYVYEVATCLKKGMTP